MYIRKERKQNVSVLRVLVLTILILAGLWLIQNRPDWARPFEPTPTPTLTAAFHTNRGDILFAEGRLRQAIQAYEQAIALGP
ncbi:MAG: tetratricopeptide repeat protein [Anaerolineae bacterium]